VGSAMDIKRLIDLARKGDTQAKSELFTYYREHLRKWVQQSDASLQSKFDASDVIQETCFHAASNLGRFRGVSRAEFETWLRCILMSRQVRLMRDYRYTQKRDVRKERRIATSDDTSARRRSAVLAVDSSSPSKLAAQSERNGILREAIADLPNDYREVVIRHGIHGESMSQVARSTGRTESNAWKLWARALLALRRCLKAD